MSEPDSEILKRRIINAVGLRWSRPYGQRSAYLLSQLGKDFPSEVRALSQGRKLLDLIRGEFSSDLKLVSTGEGGQRVWAVVPSSADDTEASKEIPTSDLSVTGSRWHPAVWAAFRAPLTAGLERVILSKDGRFWFQDLKQGEALPEGTVLQLKQHEIADTTEADSQASVRIAAMLNDRSIPFEQFLASRSSRSESNPAARARVGSRTLLDELLNCLSPGEARRVSVPLDIISKLHRHTLEK